MNLLQLRFQLVDGVDGGVSQAIGHHDVFHIGRHGLSSTTLGILKASATYRVETSMLR